MNSRDDQRTLDLFDRRTSINTLRPSDSNQLETCSVLPQDRPTSITNKITLMIDECYENFTTSTSCIDTPKPL